MLMTILYTLLSWALPKLLDMLLDRLKRNIPLTEKEIKATNQAVWYCVEIQQAARSCGCTPFGERPPGR